MAHAASGFPGHRSVKSGGECTRHKWRPSESIKTRSRFDGQRHGCEFGPPDSSIYSPSLAPWLFLRPLPSPSLSLFYLSRFNMSSDTDSSCSSYVSSQATPVKSQQDIEMEFIRNKRMAAQSGVKGKYTKRNVCPHFSFQSLQQVLFTLFPLVAPLRNARPHPRNALLAVPKKLLSGVVDPMASVHSATHVVYVSPSSARSTFVVGAGVYALLNLTNVSLLLGV